jgi:predicted MFS family arabinose efflux permease
MLILLAAINFTHIMDFMIMMPMAPQLMKKLEIGPDQFSLLVASYSLAAGLASFVGTFLVDGFDRKKVLLTCYSGFVVGTFLCGFAPSYTFLLTARVFTGLLGGVIGSQVLSIVGDLIPAQHRGKATGMVMTGFSAASVLGVPVGLYAANKWSWEMPFYGIGVMGLVVFGLAFFLLPPVRQHLLNQDSRGSWMKQLPRILQVPSHRTALLFTVLVAFSHFTIIPFLSPYMVANVGFKETELSYIYMFGGALTLYTGPLIGKQVDRYGAVPVFTWLVVISIIPLLSITHLPPVAVWVALIFTSLFFIFSGGRFVPSQALTISAVQPEVRGGFMSLNSSVMQLGSGLAALIAGKIVSKDPSGHLLHYEWLGYITLIFSLATIWFSRVLLRSTQKEKSEAVPL